MRAAPPAWWQPSPCWRPGWQPVATTRARRRPSRSARSTPARRDLSGTDYEDPAAVGDAFDRIAELDPPDEIAEEFRAVIALNQEFSAGEGADLSDQQAASELQEQFSESAAELEEESQKVDDFLTEECGVSDS